MTFDLSTVELFSGLSRTDIDRLSEGLGERLLAAATVLFEEGDAADVAYVIADGELEILKESGDRQVRIAVSGPGDVVGEMALLTAEPRSASAKALTDVRLISIPKECLDAVLSTSVEANRALFDVFISRWRQQESRVRQSERMAQLGVLTAGLAHEMNNPAAAVSAGADQLADVIEARVGWVAGLPPGITLPVPSAGGERLSALERADHEEAIEDTLGDLGVSDAWRLAGVLLDGGYRAGDFASVPRDHADVAIHAVASAVETTDLVHQIGEGASRLSALVSALKSYSFHDQAPVQNVDVAKGIEDTLLILRPKLGDIEVIREFDDIAPITAFGSQLNQVWTNLIDNAIDAIRDAGVSGGRITIGVTDAEDRVAVTVANNGPPIPPVVMDRIFEAFYTTKEPGKGTGLGLDTVYNIVVTQHRGSIDVASDDAATVFTVHLPRDQAESPDP